MDGAGHTNGKAPRTRYNTISHRQIINIGHWGPFHILALKDGPKAYSLGSNCLPSHTVGDNYIDTKPGINIVDIACGSGYFYGSFGISLLVFML